MARSLEDLHPDMLPLAKKFISIMGENNVLVYCTRRTLLEQAKLYRQSRSATEIALKIDELKERGYLSLAKAINAAGPQFGQHVTNAGPGESWHNFGFAFDAVPVSEGKPVWNTISPLWSKFGRAVEEAGLVWGGSWKKFPDYCHVQVHSGTNPLVIYRPAQVDELCRFS